MTNSDFLNIILHATFAFIVLFIISKILGKKQVAQLEFIDYVVGISIGSIAAEMAFSSEVPYYHFIVAMLIFGGLDYLITIISRKTGFFKSFFKGRPIILIAKGKIVYENLRKSKLDIDELISQCRNKGYFNINDIEYCIFETSGDFSILPKYPAKQVSTGDFNLPKQDVGLLIEIVIDGKIINKELEQLNIKKEWLLKKLKVKNKQDLKNIALVTCDENTKEINIQYKNTQTSNQIAKNK